MKKKNLLLHGDNIKGKSLTPHQQKLQALEQPLPEAFAEGKKSIHFIQMIHWSIYFKTI